MRLLFDAGYLDRLPLILPTLDVPRSNAVNVLTKKGHLALAAFDPEFDWHWTSDRAPAWFSLNEHRSWGIILLSTLLAASVTEGYGYWGVMDDQRLHRLAGEGLHLKAIPDGFVVLEAEPDAPMPFCLEVDLTNESISVWQKKVDNYGYYLKHHYNDEFPGLPKPVILTACKTERRRDTLRATTAEAHGGNAWWFATIADILESPFAHIWTTPTGARRSIPDCCRLAVAS